MEMKIYGIKCDKCDYNDMSVGFKDYPNYINKPCPLCGENLLIQKEYDECLIIYKRFEFINKILNVLRWLNLVYLYRVITGKVRESTYIYTFPKRKKNGI